jgi:hypothetical protein
MQRESEFVTYPIWAEGEVDGLEREQGNLVDQEALSNIMSVMKHR